MSAGASGGDTPPPSEGDGFRQPAPTPAELSVDSDLSESGPDSQVLTERIIKDVANAFKLLADETRLKILSFLVEEEELNVRSLCERLDQSQPAVSHHLALMRQAGLIASRRQGKNNFYRLMPKRMEEIRNLVGEMFLKRKGEFRAAV
ncbi:MAG: metalloregulator ArsR/SmtB family transcription factor [Planctomycetales bacterium]|nr:metalloregulator ArsR/SmtB family transcription factor [Planctomycetales bacterium]